VLVRRTRQVLTWGFSLVGYENISLVSRNAARENKVPFNWSALDVRTHHKIIEVNEIADESEKPTLAGP
jgi:hypothetical protein